MVKETRKIWGVRCGNARSAGTPARASVCIGGIRARMRNKTHHYRPEPRLRPLATHLCTTLTLRPPSNALALHSASALAAMRARCVTDSLAPFAWPLLQVTDIQVSATCIRVPVMRAHAESINLTFKGTLSEADALKALTGAPGVSIINDRAANRFPTPLDATNKDDVYVGRVRADISQPAGKGLDLFVCGDQIRKGAALNAIQIAELLL